MPGLSKVVSEGVSKAAMRLDGVAALLAAAYIAGADMKADTALDKEEVGAGCYTSWLWGTAHALGSRPGDCTYIF